MYVKNALTVCNIYLGPRSARRIIMLTHRLLLNQRHTAKITTLLLTILLMLSTTHHLIQRHPPRMLLLTNLLSIQSTLSPFHPLLIEGPSKDNRDPSHVASQIVSDLRSHWKRRNVTKPILLITQGDPLTERGISAITRLVADELNVKRCLVCLDEHIDSQHSVLADRHDVQLELRYSHLVDIINKNNHCADNKTCSSREQQQEEEPLIDVIDRAIDERIDSKNKKLKAINLRPMAPWSKQYALLQEVTKLGFKRICGEVTIAHTVQDVPEFGVTGFYEVGLELGLIDESMDMVGYSSK